MTEVWIDPLALDAILSECDRMYPEETGGALMGYGGGGEGFVVTAVVGPGPDAQHNERWFVPDDEYQRGEIARIYEESGRTERYLGDWHSHPTSSAYLSPRDRRTFRRIARRKEARAPTPIMMVVGGDPEAVRVWVLPKRRRFRLRRPTPCLVSVYPE